MSNKETKVSSPLINIVIIMNFFLLDEDSKKSPSPEINPAIKGLSPSSFPRSLLNKQSVSLNPPDIKPMNVQKLSVSFAKRLRMFGSSVLEGFNIPRATAISALARNP